MNMGDDERRQIPVKVTNFEEMVFRTEEKEPEHFSCTTVTLQAGQAGQTILAHDPLRKEAVIMAIDNPVVLCDSAGQAMSQSNQVTGIPAPDGAYIFTGIALKIAGTGQLWGACAVATRVMVIVTRRSS